MTENSEQRPLIVVSADTHIGGRIVDDFRQYCPPDLLDDFDRHVAQIEEDRKTYRGHFAAGVASEHPNARTAGHYDSTARLADYDYDGIAAGVMFHGSQNFEPLPFMPFRAGAPDHYDEPKYRAASALMYNRYLADLVADSPHRHIALAQLPMWDVEAAIAELRWAHEHGLKGVNFPAFREGELPEWNKPVWEPFWVACNELKMPLCTHTGGGSKAEYTGVEASALTQIEGFGFMGRRNIWWLIFGGVFERYPDVKFVMAESPGTWWYNTAFELDGVWEMQAKPGSKKELWEKVPRRPSDYMATNVYFGASFASAYEAEQAVLNGVDTQFLWGSDYPHTEGTFVYPDGRDMPSVTKLSLRNSFCDVTAEQAARMVGGNAIDVFNLDRDALQAIADEIGALTPEELATPIDTIPEGASTTAFRSTTSYWS